MATLIAELAPAAVSASLGGKSDTDIITVDFDLPDNGTSWTHLRPALEAALAAEVMHVAWSGSGGKLSGVYADLASHAIIGLKASLTGVKGFPGRIEPAA